MDYCSEERINKIKTEIEEKKKAIETIKNKSTLTDDKKDSEIKMYMSIIKSLEGELDDIKYRKYFEIISDYLQEKRLPYSGYRITEVSGDKIYLEILAEYRTRIKVIYNLKGEVLLDAIKEKDHWRTYRIDEDEDEWRYSKHYKVLNPGTIFAGENDIIIPRRDIHSTIPNYEHYRLENGHYILIHSFTNNRQSDAGEGEYEDHFHMLKTQGNELLGTYKGRLYDIRKGKYIGKAKYDKILDAYSVDHEHGCQDPYLGFNMYESSKIIQKHLKENNLLAGVTKFIVDFGYKIEVEALVYLDTKGNIVSDLFYCPLYITSHITGIEEDVRIITIENQKYDDALREAQKCALEDLKEKVEEQQKKYEQEKIRLKRKGEKNASIISFNPIK